MHDACEGIRSSVRIIAGVRDGPLEKRVFLYSLGLGTVSRRGLIQVGLSEAGDIQ